MIARTFFSKQWHEDGTPWFKVNLPFSCDIHMNFIDFERLATTPSDVKKVYMDINEPTFYGQDPKIILEFGDKFDVIITKHPEVLEKYKHAYTDVWASTYINPNKNIDKDFSVSFLCTNKKHFDGYKVRHQLWERQSEISISKRFWSSKYLPVDESRIIPGDGSTLDKMILFTSMFSICPENSSEPNYLTEKIMDCFLTMTVPVYRGCSNFNTYFNPNGVIFFDTIDDLIEKVNKLTPDDYFKRMEAMNQNFIKATFKMDPADRVSKIIIAHINENRSII